jgi:hypothetical protein
VAVLQSGFVGDLFFAEVVAKPRHTLSETGELWRHFRGQNRNSGSDTLSVGREVKKEIQA